MRRKKVIVPRKSMKYTGTKSVAVIRQSLVVHSTTK